MTVKNDEYGLTGRRPRTYAKLGAVGTTFAVTLLLLLSATSAGGPVRPNALVKAPYKGSAGTPSYGSNIYGCATTKTTLPKWSASSGVLVALDSASARTCGRGVGYVGSSSTAYANGGAEVAVPFRVASNGNHSIGLNFAVTLSSSANLTTSGCPAKKVNYHPALYASSYGSCYDYVYLDLYVNAWLLDLDNSNWYGYTYSYAYAYNTTGWENYTDCYNSGTTSCYNFTGPYSYQYAYGTNSPGLSKLSFNGATLFTVWTNGTTMVKADHYAVIFSLSTTLGASSDAYSLQSLWSGRSSGSFNMATLGNGAQLTSVQVV